MNELLEQRVSWFGGRIKEVRENLSQNSSALDSLIRAAKEEHHNTHDPTDTHVLPDQDSTNSASCPILGGVGSGSQPELAHNKPSDFASPSESFDLSGRFSPPGNRGRRSRTERFDSGVSVDS